MFREVLPSARFKPKRFGKKEVLNRLYFVSKNPELSRPLCCFALSVRAAMSLFLGLARCEFGYFKRVAGNVAGLTAALGEGPRHRRMNGIRA